MRWKVAFAVGLSAIAIACGLSVVGGADDGVEEGSEGGPDGSDAPAPPTGDDAGTGGDAADAADATPEAARDVHSPIVGITCAGTTCAVSTQACEKCPSAAAKCTSPGTDPSCNGSLHLVCDDSVDCAATDDCCVDVTSGASVNSRCRTGCQTGEEVLCDPDTPVPCPHGGTCVVDTRPALGGRSFCKP